MDWSKKTQKYKRTLECFDSVDKLSLENPSIPEKFASLSPENMVAAIKEELGNISLVEELLSSLSSSFSKAFKNAKKKR